MSTITFSGSQIRRSGHEQDGHVLIPRIGRSLHLRGQRYDLSPAGQDFRLSIIDCSSERLIIYISSECASLALDCAAVCPERIQELQYLLREPQSDSLVECCCTILTEHLSELTCAERDHALWYGSELSEALELLDLLNRSQLLPRY